MHAISVENLSATRSGRPVFCGLSFNLGQGEALILNGPNGSGKSTLLRILASLGEATSGKIDFTGLLDEQKPAESCHYVAHADALKSALTASENLAFWAQFYEGGTPADALDKFAIGHLADIPAGLLSAGQKRRLGLARLLLASRPLWLLDEPTVSLDTASQDILAGVMQAHVKAGGILIAATHLPLGLEKCRTLDMGDFKASAEISWPPNDAPDHAPVARAPVTRALVTRSRSSQ